MQPDYPIQLIHYPSFQTDVDQQFKEIGQVKVNEQDIQLNQTTFGCKKLCQIDCLLVERYFNQLQEVFRTSNQLYTLESEKLNNTDWLIDRMQHRYRTKIYSVFQEIIVRGDINPSQQTGFKYLEKNVNKPRVPLPTFLKEIQLIIHEFLNANFQH